MNRRHFVQALGTIAGAIAASPLLALVPAPQPVSHVGAIIMWNVDGSSEVWQFGGRGGPVVTVNPMPFPERRRYLST